MRQPFARMPWLLARASERIRFTQCGRGGARPARREKRAYRAYVSDEQRRPARGPQRGTRVGVGAGCLGGQTGTLIHFQVLSRRFASSMRVTFSSYDRAAVASTRG